METTQERPVRIHLAMKDSPLPRAIKQVLRVLDNGSLFTYVESMDEADLVVFTEVRDIERGYSKEKSYVSLEMPGARTTPLPENCVTLETESLLVGLIEVIEATGKKLNPIVEEPTAPTGQTVSPSADALSVLVIDDTPKHIASAKAGLAGNYRLTTASGYEEAMEILAKQKFTIVLTDLHLPMSSKTMGDKFRLGELVPYGVLLMVEAARQGAKFVGVVTDLSHHDDPFSAAFDHYSRFQFQIDGANVLMMHARLDRDGAKDWADALRRLTTI
jgi:CheY-like chemotaxis protein